MLVQAAQTGARSRLFLLDEVDAALDESNQARVAALLHRMCAPGAPQRCQVRGSPLVWQWKTPRWAQCHMHALCRVCNDACRARDVHPCELALL